MKISVPQLLKEKRKALVGTIAVVAIAGFSFVAGKKITGTPDPHAIEQVTDRPEVPSRSPASEPKSPEKRDEDRENEREVDEEEIQIAHQRSSTERAASGHQGGVIADAAADEPEHPKVAHAVEAHSKEGFFSRLTTTYVEALHSVHGKVVRLHHSEEENRNLRIENAHLRVKLETQKFDCRLVEAKKHTEKVGSKLNALTGTRVGRTLASIQYQIPENLLPEQLHALGVGYMKASDYERGAAILTFLTEMEGDTTFKTPENFMLTGVAWYKLENFKNAHQFFERALKDPTSSPKIKTQAKVWNAIISQRTKNYAEAQEWLRQTLESDPQSKEAHWVNPQEGRRIPASKEAASAHEKDEHENHH